MTRKEYVLGFLFWKNSVVLTLKEFPAWQKGKWNGVGGKIEKGETPQEAMEREGMEELGPLIPWVSVGNVQGKDFVLFVFKARDDKTCPTDWLPIRNDAGERVELLNVDLVQHMTFRGSAISNLSYLIPLCLDTHVSDFIITDGLANKDQVVYGEDQG